MGRRSSGSYETMVNGHISLAQSVADTAVRNMPHETEAERQAHDAAWTEAFHDMMDRLCAQAGLRFTTRAGCEGPGRGTNGAAA